VKTTDIIDALEGMSGINEKKALLRSAFEAGNREFFIGARLAYDKLISFGVKKVPAIEVEDDDDDGTLDFGQFMVLANRMRRREVTGHAARDAMVAAAEMSGPIWNKFYRRVLLKDLKVRVSDSIINKVLAEIGTPEALEYRVPVFECQLAEDSKKHPKKMKGQKFLDIKLDGIRMLSVLDKEAGEVTMYTRNGIETENFPHIKAALTKMLPHVEQSLVLDGEMLGDTFQNLMKQVQRSDPKTEDMKLGLFDVIPLKDFKTGLCKITQRQRHATLCDFQTSGLLQTHTGDSVYVIPKLEVNLDTEQGQKEMREFFSEACLAGYEGIMIKDPEAGYEGRKYSAWLKWKPTISVTLKVTALEQGKPESEFHDTLGALVCEGVDDVSEEATGKHYSQIRIKSNCGSGFTVDQRRAWWNNPSDIVGWMVEIEADAVSLNQNTTDVYSLRFPRFKGKRGTVPGEKI
jgi:DNA ligase 1